MITGKGLAALRTESGIGRVRFTTVIVRTPQAERTTTTIVLVFIRTSRVRFTSQQHKVSPMSLARSQPASGVGPCILLPTTSSPGSPAPLASIGQQHCTSVIAMLTRNSGSTSAASRAASSTIFRSCRASRRGGGGDRYGVRTRRPWPLSACCSNPEGTAHCRPRRGQQGRRAKFSTGPPGILENSPTDSPEVSHSGCARFHLGNQHNKARAQLTPTAGKVISVNTADPK